MIPLLRVECSINEIENNFGLHLFSIMIIRKTDSMSAMSMETSLMALFYTQINTTEETFQSDIIDSTIFQTNSFDVLSEFALLVSSTTCSAYSSVLSNESEKMFQQNFQNNLFHLNKFDNDSEFFGQRNCCSADCVAGPA